MFKLDGMDVKDSARPGSRKVKSRQKSYSNGDDQDGVQVVNWNQQAFKSAEGENIIEHCLESHRELTLFSSILVGKLVRSVEEQRFSLCCGVRGGEASGSPQQENAGEEAEW